MILELYTFSPSSYVVAEEWNANFNVLYTETYSHSESIVDAFQNVAFSWSDLTEIYDSVRGRQNSWGFATTNDVYIKPEQEYYKTLSSTDRVNIHIPDGMNAEARILIYLQQPRNVIPFMVASDYHGTVKITYGTYSYNYFRAGYYYIMIYETNGLAQLKLIWTGV